MLALLLTILALAVGPLIHQLVLSRPAALELLDSFAVLTIGGLVLLQIVPEALGAGGWPAGLAVLLGVASPVLAEELLQRAAEKVHRLFLVVALLGIGLHALFDGLALAQPHGDEHTSLLALGVVIHSVPVGLTVSWLLLPGYGRLAVIGTILFMVIATVAGFQSAPYLAALEGGAWLAVLQAFVAGSLVHVLLHRPHLESELAAVPLKKALAMAAGSLAAAATLGFLLVWHAHERPPLGLVLLGASVLVVFLFLHYAPRRWIGRLSPRRHRHHEH